MPREHLTGPPIRRVRADRLLVDRGLFESRSKAQQAIAAGTVTADGRRLTKPAEEISADAILEAAPAHPWVSRGGIKLAAALDHFGINPAGRICLDVGASTGGFTDVLLARGAGHVDAIDVGRGQLHPRLRGRPQVALFEGTDIRTLDPALLHRPIELVTVDVSFIPLKLVLPAALALAAPPRGPRRLDQAAIRGRPRARDQRHRARCGGPRPGL